MKRERTESLRIWRKVAYTCGDGVLQIIGNPDKHDKLTRRDYDEIVESIRNGFVDLRAKEGDKDYGKVFEINCISVCQLTFSDFGFGSFMDQLLSIDHLEMIDFAGVQRHPEKRRMPGERKYRINCPTKTPSMTVKQTDMIIDKVSKNTTLKRLAFRCIDGRTIDEKLTRLTKNNIGLEMLWVDVSDDVFEHKILESVICNENTNIKDLYLPGTALENLSHAYCSLHVLKEMNPPSFKDRILIVYGERGIIWYLDEKLISAVNS